MGQYAQVLQGGSELGLLLGQREAAVALFDRVIAIRERLGEQEGRRELTGDWARAIVVQAYALAQLGKTDQARGKARWAIATLENEVKRTGRADLQQVLDFARENLPH